MFRKTYGEHTMPLSQTKTMSSKESVLQQHPTAFVHDDGDWIYIQVTKEVTEPCPHCKQSWTHNIVDPTSILGSGGNESAAWKNAAKSLGLLP